MAFTKDRKKALVEEYKNLIGAAKNIVVMKQSSIPVNEINNVRMSVYEDGWKLQVVKKRLFLRALKESGYDVDLNVLDWSIIVLYSLEDEFKPLKSINKIIKKWKKDKKNYELSYLGGFFENEWKDVEYVKAVAELPTKDELIGQFAFLLKWPVQSFVMNLKQIAENKS